MTTPRLLLAPAGHGKTETVVHRIRQLLADEPLTPVVVIVPNMLQAAGFRQRLSSAGGALGVEVHTFHTLYAELLARAGQPMPLLTDPLRIRLLHALLDDLCQKGEIRYYAGVRQKPGFIAALRTAIEELKRTRIFPEIFAAAVQGLGPRLEEIANVYSAYQDWLQRQAWADNEGRGWLAAIALEQNPELGTELSFLAVSGFDEFNPTQLGVLSLLAKRANETIITLTGDLQRPQRPAHHRFQRAQAALVTSLGIEPESLPSSSLLAAPLAQVESALFENQSSRKPSEHDGADHKSEIEFVEAQTRAVEARAALRWLKARIVRDGMSLDDLAVLARDIEPYRPFLEETAAEFGIPLRIAGGQPLKENPAVTALLALLSIPCEDWPRRQIIEAWRCPYFDWRYQGIDPDSAATLDEVSRVGKVLHGLSQWREAFDMWEKKKVTTDEDGDSLYTMEVDRQVEERFKDFVALLTPPAHAKAKQFIAFIEDLIGDDLALLPPSFGGEIRDESLHVVACACVHSATAERDMTALRAFKDVLRGLVLAEAMFPVSAHDYADFYVDLRAAVEAAAYTIPTQAGILAASVLDGRGLTFQAVAVLGLSEGEFPRLERQDILLSESDRAVLRERGLPLETRLHGDEGSLFYQSVTRARQRLLLTRPYLAEDGQPWDASPFWEEMSRLNRNQPPVRVRPEDGLEPAEAASRVEWREAARDFDIHMQNGVEALQARLAPIPEGRYEGQLFDLSERFGTRHGWSASRLESYGTCPFEFFTAYALGLEPRLEPEEGFDVRVLGSMLHKILEEVYSAALGVEECLALLPRKARAVFKTAPEEYGFRPTPLWEIQKAELEQRLRETITALAEVSQGYKPLVLEAKFGMGAPALVLDTVVGKVRLHGYIDRLDVAPDGTLRVIDYKSGSTPISASHLKEGRRLQLPIYGLAAQDVLGLGDVSSGFYWHIQKAEASSLKLEKYEGGVGEAFATAIAHIGRHVKGIRTGHFEPKPPAEGCPNYCPAVGFCWRYKKGF